MEQNPIYDGPVYETIHPQFEALTLRAPNQTETSADNCSSTPFTPQNPESSIHPNTTSDRDCLNELSLSQFCDRKEFDNSQNVVE